MGCDPRRFFLVSLSRGLRLEPLALHALDLRAHTPPLGRFLLRVAKSTSSQITPFSWDLRRRGCLPAPGAEGPHHPLSRPDGGRRRRLPRPRGDVARVERCRSGSSPAARFRTIALTKGDQTLRLDLMREGTLRCCAPI